MKTSSSIVAALVLAAAPFLAFGQAAPPTLVAMATPQTAAYPNTLNGYWKWIHTGMHWTFTQQFNLKDIQVAEDGTFQAKLSWYGFDAKCWLRDSPVTGTTAPDGKSLRFDFDTKCIVWKARLARENPTDRNWVGTVTLPTDDYSLELEAKSAR